jgi:hypothetical protein
VNQTSFPTPDWLAKRGGLLKAKSDGETWAVVFDGRPQYEIKPIPQAGKFGCEVLQTVNGKRLESGAVYLNHADALRGGLEDLRKALGW